MIFRYGTVTVGSHPLNPGIGDIWITRAGGQYNVSIWITGWVLCKGGGAYIAETDPDTHRLNIVISDDMPTGDNIKIGWLWINETTRQAYIKSWGEFLQITGGMI